MALSGDQCISAIEFTINNPFLPFKILVGRNPNYRLVKLTEKPYSKPDPEPAKYLSPSQTVPGKLLKAKALEGRLSQLSNLELVLGMTKERFQLERKN